MEKRIRKMFKSVGYKPSERQAVILEDRGRYILVTIGLDSMGVSPGHAMYKDLVKFMENNNARTDTDG